jgi:hypothetical protein
MVVQRETKFMSSPSHPISSLNTLGDGMGWDRTGWDGIFRDGTGWDIYEIP